MSDTQASLPDNDHPSGEINSSQDKAASSPQAAPTSMEGQAAFEETAFEEADPLKAPLKAPSEGPASQAPEQGHEPVDQSTQPPASPEPASPEPEDPLKAPLKAPSEGPASLNSPPPSKASPPPSMKAQKIEPSLDSAPLDPEEQAKKEREAELLKLLNNFQKEARLFDYFQAMRWLYRFLIHHKDQDPKSAIRIQSPLFSVRHNLKNFLACEKSHHGYLLSTHVMSMYGPHGVMPPSFTDALIEMENDAHFAMRDLINLMQSSIHHLYYQFLLRQHSVVRLTEYEGPDAYRSLLYQSAKLSSRALGQSFEEPSRLLRYHRLFMRKRRTIRGIEKLVLDYFKDIDLSFDLIIEGFVPSRTVIEPASLTRLGTFANRLGETVKVGSLFKGSQGGLCFKIHLDSAEAYHQFLYRSAIRTIVELARFYFGVEYNLVFEVSYTSQAKDLAFFDTQTRDHLGANAWLDVSTKEHERGSKQAWPQQPQDESDPLPTPELEAEQGQETMMEKLSRLNQNAMQKVRREAAERLSFLEKELGEPSLKPIQPKAQSFDHSRFSYRRFAQGLARIQQEKEGKTLGASELAWPVDELAQFYEYRLARFFKTHLYDSHPDKVHDTLSLGEEDVNLESATISTPAIDLDQLIEAERVEKASPTAELKPGEQAEESQAEAPQAAEPQAEESQAEAPQAAETPQTEAPQPFPGRLTQTQAQLSASALQEAIDQVALAEQAFEDSGEVFESALEADVKARSQIETLPKGPLQVDLEADSQAISAPMLKPSSPIPLQTPSQTIFYEAPSKLFVPNESGSVTGQQHSLLDYQKGIIPGNLRREGDEAFTADRNALSQPMNPKAFSALDKKPAAKPEPTFGQAMEDQGFSLSQDDLDRS